jgi:hypothetical protein
MKQLTGFLILIAVLFSCKQQPLKQIEPIIIYLTDTVYVDTCDSEFIRKIGQIETGNTDSLTEINGHGKGRFQIYNICVKGSGLTDLLGYSHNDMFNAEKSKHVFWATMGIFCHTYAQKHGHYPTYEQLARMWCGGPEGYKKNATLNYLHKFKQQ